MRSRVTAEADVTDLSDIPDCDAPAELEHKRAPLNTLEANPTTGELEGYASTFGGVDSYGDRIAPGAFTATLAAWRRKGRFPPMLVQHGGLMLGDGDGLPVGVWTDMREDDRGLQVKGRLIGLDTDRGRHLLEALQTKALDGLSIGFRAVEAEPARGEQGVKRVLTRVDLVEVSLVTFPANEDARVTAVKGVETPAAFERWLRDHGWPRKAAKKLAAGGWPALARGREEPSEEEARALLEAIESARRTLTSGD